MPRAIFPRDYFMRLMPHLVWEQGRLMGERVSPLGAKKCGKSEEEQYPLPHPRDAAAIGRIRSESRKPRRKFHRNYVSQTPRNPNVTIQKIPSVGTLRKPQGAAFRCPAFIPAQNGDDGTRADMPSHFLHSYLAAECSHSLRARHVKPDG